MRAYSCRIVFGILLGLSCGSRADAQNVDARSAAVQLSGPAGTTYSGDYGPGFWYKYDARCAPSPTGMQSPIDIDRVTVDPDLHRLELSLAKTAVDLQNTGSTIVALPPKGASAALGTLHLGGVSYDLKQFHFHTLSEHTVDGHHGVMELHLVFQDAHDDLAVIGVIYRIGQPNHFLQKLIEAHLPEQTTSPLVAVKGIDIGNALTDTARYFRYKGSLTTPNCKEGVRWTVLKDWAELSPEQFESFRTILGNDFRPLQLRNDRVILATADR